MRGENAFAQALFHIERTRYISDRGKNKRLYPMVDTTSYLNPVFRAYATLIIRDNCRAFSLFGNCTYNTPFS